MFGIRPNLPAPVPDTPPAPPQSHRTKYVVLGVMNERTSESETVYTIRLRRADQSVCVSGTPAYVYRVAQTPELPVPAATNAVLEIDSRLVDVEQGP